MADLPTLKLPFKRKRSPTQEETMSSFSYLRVAQCIGFSGAVWLSGNIAALSLIAIPALRDSKVRDGVPSTTLVKQWRYIYEAGKSQNPPVAGITATAFLYLAWAARRITPHNRNALFYGSAAILTLGIVPFTLIAMSQTNNCLITHSDTVSKDADSAQSQARDNEIDQLLIGWKNLNAVRSLLPLAGGILGLIASFA